MYVCMQSRHNIPLRMLNSCAIFLVLNPEDEDEDEEDEEGWRG